LKHFNFDQRSLSVGVADLVLVRRIATVMFHSAFLLLTCLVTGLPLLASSGPLDAPPADAGTRQRIDFYVSRLGDRKYVKYQMHDDTARPWYVPAEELGRIGSPAVSPLVEKLKMTTDVYERTITFYALRLAAQASEINIALGQTIPDYPLTWPPEEDHQHLKRLWLEWWGKYGSTIQNLATERLAHEH
jgi:hypothetical protein